jgi:hypothetical protein
LLSVITCSDIVEISASPTCHKNDTILTSRVANLSMKNYQRSQKLLFFAEQIIQLREISQFEKYLARLAKHGKIPIYRLMTLYIRVVSGVTILSSGSCRSM